MSFRVPELVQEHVVSQSARQNGPCQLLPEVFITEALSRSRHTQTTSKLRKLLLETDNVT